MIPDPRSFFPTDRFGDVRDFVPVSAGLSGAAVYSVTTSTGDFVLRVQGDDRGAWKRATAMQRLAAEHGIAPSLEFVDEARAGSVSTKIQGIPFGAALADPSVRSAALADLVQRLIALHAIRVPVSEASPNTPAVADSLWQSQVNRPGFPAWAVALGERLSEAGALLASDPRKVLSHCDLHPANILWDGTRVWLLDWERAGLAHPYVDLATLSSFMNLKEDAALALLAAQEGTEIDVRARQTFRAARERCRIVYGAAFLRLVPDLTIVPLASREETPTLAQCYERRAKGALALDTAEGRALIGAAFLKQTE